MPGLSYRSEEASTATHRTLPTIDPKNCSKKELRQKSKAFNADRKTLRTLEHEPCRKVKNNGAKPDNVNRSQRAKRAHSAPTPTDKRFLRHHLRTGPQQSGRQRRSAKAISIWPLSGDRFFNPGARSRPEAAPQPAPSRSPVSLLLARWDNSHYFANYPESQYYASRYRHTMAFDPPRSRHCPTIARLHSSAWSSLTAPAPPSTSPCPSVRHRCSQNRSEPRLRRAGRKAGERIRSSRLPRLLSSTCSATLSFPQRNRCASPRPR